MGIRRVVRTALVALAVACLAAPAVAAGAVMHELNNVTHPVIYLNAGVHSARLGMTDAKVKTRVGLKWISTKRDNRYENQVMYHSGFGAKCSGGRQAETVSDSKHVVWMFEINGPALRTSKGIHVGSTAASLENAYSSLKKNVGDKTTTYTYGTVRGKGTDFYVSNSTHKVFQILVRNW